MCAGIVAQIVHAYTLPHVHATYAICEAHTKQPHSSIRTRSAVVAIVATVRALPRHLVMLQGCQLDNLLGWLG